MSKPLFMIKKGVAKEVAMIEIDKLCQEKGVTDFDVMTEEEFNNVHFPEVTFENSPQEVELKLVNDVQGK